MNPPRSSTRVAPHPTGSDTRASFEASWSPHLEQTAHRSSLILLVWPSLDAGPMTAMIYRTLGKTGEHVSAIGMGGWHLALPHVSEQAAVGIVRAALDAGINFLDNSWDYNGGASETRVGKALRDGYRDKAFVMTKIDGRSRRAATEQLHESLRRLGVECIDLVQHHEVIRHEDPRRARAASFAPRSCYENSPRPTKMLSRK